MSPNTLFVVLVDVEAGVNSLLPLLPLLLSQRAKLQLHSQLQLKKFPSRFSCWKRCSCNCEVRRSSEAGRRLKDRFKMRKLGRIDETSLSAPSLPLPLPLPLPCLLPPPKTPGATLSMRLLLKSSDRSDFKLLKIVDDSKLVRLLLRIDKWTRCWKLRAGKS